MTSLVFVNLHKVKDLARELNMDEFFIAVGDDHLVTHILSDYFDIEAKTESFVEEDYLAGMKYLSLNHNRIAVRFAREEDATLFMIQYPEILWNK